MNAQVPGKFSLGVEGGIQFTNLSGFDTYYSTRSKTGFYAGIFGEYHISEKFNLRLGFDFDRRNFELNGYKTLADTTGAISNSYYVYQVDYGVKYLTIPLSIIYKTGGTKFKIYIRGGIYYSILINAEHQGIEGYFIDGDDKIDIGGTILHNGNNDFYLDGKSKSLEFVNTSNEFSQPDQLSYRKVKLNSSDYGLSVFVGFVYEPGPSIGITIAPGFSYSIPKAFTEPGYNDKWKQITRINIGMIYSINNVK
jgi:hypothetical protein